MSSYIFKCMLVVLLTATVVSCSSNNNTASDGDMREAEEINEAEEACRTDCDSNEGCRYFKRMNCSNVTEGYSDLCLGEVLYRCQTPPDSPCCEGYQREYMPIGACETDTPGCGVNAETDGDGAETADESESAEDAGESE